MTAAPPSSQLEIEALRKAFPGGVVAVDGVSLKVERGEALALLGPSGCGKTTLLQAIAGFVAPDEGEIRLDGQSILATPPERRRTAMMFQQYALFPYMTVRDNVGFGLKMMRVRNPEASARVAEALRLVRIEALAERRPAQLSGGQKQRVALARAIVTEPRMLLLDEPLGALDQNLREEMQVELRKLQRRLGVTTVLVTHDQREAIVLADRIAVMRAGRIEQIGTANDIYDRPLTRFVAQFTGVENVLPVKRLGAGALSFAGALLEGVNDPGTPGDKRLAVRAEAVSLLSSPQGAAWTGVVSFVQMLGPSLRYEVDMADGSRVIALESRRESSPIEQGAQVGLAFARSRCTLVDA